MRHYKAIIITNGRWDTDDEDTTHMLRMELTFAIGENAHRQDAEELVNRTLQDMHISNYVHVESVTEFDPQMCDGHEPESFADFVLAGGNPAEWKGETPSVQDWAEVKSRTPHGDIRDSIDFVRGRRYRMYIADDNGIEWEYLLTFLVGSQAARGMFGIRSDIEHGADADYSFAWGRIRYAGEVGAGSPAITGTKLEQSVAHRVRSKRAKEHGGAS